MSDELAIPNPVLDRAKELIRWYRSFDSDLDVDTALRLTYLEVRAANVDEAEAVGMAQNDPHREDCFVIACRSVELHGPIGEQTGDHDSAELLTGSGRLLRATHDGVDQGPARF